MSRALRLLAALGVLAVGGCAGSEVSTGSGAAGSGAAGTAGTAGTGASGTSGSGAAGTTGTAGTGPGAGGSGTGGTTGGAGTTGSAGTTGAGGGGAGRGGAAGSAAGTTGTGGAAGRGGTTGTAGRGGMTGSAGATGTAGNGSTGTGGSVACTITATSTQSTAIPTVFTVTWSTTLAGITGAEIDFGPSSTGPTMVAPVDLGQASYKTFLLGMKPSTSYVYRIVAKSGAGSCTSPDYTIMTGALANAPKPTVTISTASAHDKGFIIVSSGLNGTSAYIIDPDGTVVWYAPSGVPSQPSRVHLSWDATKMYMMSLNVQNTSAGKIVLLPMDGSASTSLANVAASHHDLTALPGGLATPMWNASGIDAPCSVVEITESGTMTTVVADVSTLYSASSNKFHTNAIHYYARDNSYTIGDRNPNLYIKMTRTGQLVWQFGGANPKDATKFFSGVTTWSVNHGHHLTADGSFVFFNNNANEMWEYKLNTSNMSATQVTHYTASGATSNVLGDAQILPNGNILVTFSTSGQIHEISPSGSLVMKITAPSGSAFGYSEFRESLYGPPPY